MFDMVADFKKFIDEVWREVRPGRGLVTWPSVENVQTSTFVVILSTIMLSGFIALCDWVLNGVRMSFL